MDKSYETDDMDSALTEFNEANLKYVNLCIYNPHLLEKILYAGLPREELGNMLYDIFNSAFKKETPKYEETKIIFKDTMKIYHKSKAKKKF